MPNQTLAQRFLLPELRLTSVTWRRSAATLHLHAETHASMEVCPRCATPSRKVYDHRTVHLKDAPVHGKLIVLHVKKRRLMCKPCKKPFTEPLAGVRKGNRSTERYRRSLLWACENFSDLSAVRKAYRCSSSVLYRTLYQQLERKQKQRQYPWPALIGIDEHFFRRDRTGLRRFVTSVVDYRKRRVFEMVDGKQIGQLEAALAHIPGRENVRWVVTDLADPYKSFAFGFFPNARVVADKFHVLRLLNPAINRRRKEITGDRRTLRVRRMLLRTGHRLSSNERFLLNRWLGAHPELREVYHFKEALHGFYRIRGAKRAAVAFTKLTDRMAESRLKEIKTLRRTLLRWRNEILAYFETGLPNGRVEGFNNQRKLVKRRGYGYRSFRNYRLRCLNACS